MLMIEFNHIGAVWSDDKVAFVCKDPLAAEALNMVLDKDKLTKVETAFLEGGVERQALLMVQAAYGDAIEIVEQTELEDIPEEPGADY